MRPLLLAWALVALVTAGCQRVGGVRVNLQRMDVQPRYEPYGGSAWFPNGMAMQAPPPGTVAREDAPAPMTPPAPSAGALELGRERYHIACAPCHGAGGFGGSIVAQNLAGVAGLSLQSGTARALTPAQLFARISLPGDVTHARARELSPAERWAVVLYARALLSGGARDSATARDSAAAAGVQRVQQEMAAELMHMNGAVP